MPLNPHIKMKTPASFRFSIHILFTLIIFFCTSFGLFPQAGQLDTSFGTEGILLKPVSVYDNTVIRASLLQDDGKIILCGYAEMSSASSILIVRIEDDGGPDYSFALGGSFVIDVPIKLTSMALQPDGKILVAGSLETIDRDLFLLRLKSTGDLDSAFGINGFQLLQTIGSVEETNAISLLSDGRIVVGGYSTSSGTKDWLLACYDTTGNLDGTFGTDGLIYLGGAGEEEILSLCVQEDDKIIAAGYSDQLGTEDFVLVRYSSDGTPDVTFSGDGLVLTGGGWLDRARSVLVQDDGKILAAGISVDPGTGDSILSLVRYTPMGNLDPDFNSVGYVTTEIEDGAGLFSAGIQSDGKIVVAGSSCTAGGDPHFSIVRYNPDGSLDTGFDTDGIVNTDIGSFGSYASSLVIREDDKIVVSGYSLDETGTYFIGTTVRYDNEGTPDPEFGSSGYAFNTVSAGLSSVISAFVQEDGKVISVGVSDVDGFLMRTDADGLSDLAFGTNGISRFTTGADLMVNDVIIRSFEGSDDKIFICGSSSEMGYQSILVGSYNMDGTENGGFGTAGFVITPVGTILSRATSIGVAANGSIIVGGTADMGSGNDFVLAAYTPEGLPDVSFSGTGIVTTDLGGDDYIYKLIVQPDGKILAAGNTEIDDNEKGVIFRYNTDGTPDLNFGTEGKVTTSYNEHDFIRSIVLQSDGKILALSSAHDDSDSDIILVRYNEDGSVDGSFGSDGIVIYDSGMDETPADMVLLENGEIVVLGHVADETGTSSRILLLRFYPLGILDPYFGTSGVTETQIGPSTMIAYSLVVLSDGKLLSAGAAFGLMYRSILAFERYHNDLSEIPNVIYDYWNKDGDTKLMIHPNPFSVSTLIQYDIEEPGFVQIKLYDISGQEIASLLNESMAAGKHELVFDASGLQEGIYFLHLNSGDCTKTQKIVIIK